MKITELKDHPGLQARLVKQMGRLDRYADRLEDIETRHEREIRDTMRERADYLWSVAEFLGIDWTPDQLLERIDSAEGKIDGLTLAEFLASHGGTE
ncbi:hypothetical protein KKA53_05045 [Candidatus Dependentiae bacterium]|nr:hypothetical protein [Candidatus Dependentiae bacterium]